MRVLAEQELAGRAEAASRRFRGNAGRLRKSDFDHVGTASSAQTSLRVSAETLANTLGGTPKWSRPSGRRPIIIADQDRSAGQVGEDLLQPG